MVNGANLKSVFYRDFQGGIAPGCRKFAEGEVQVFSRTKLGFENEDGAIFEALLLWSQVCSSRD